MYTLRLMPRTAWYWLTEGSPARRKLLAENARLRAALEKIANGPWPDFQEERPCGHPDAVTCPECSIIERARAALRGEEEK
jgi:hypothetical protein